jgi:hypothetical protein
MTLFQIVSLSILLVLFIREVNGYGRTATLWWGRGLRAAVWLSAALAIARPDWIQFFAESVGIHRGADLVFYLFVLAFLGVSFYFYARLVRTQRQMTQLIRHTALQEAQRGGEATSK